MAGDVFSTLDEPLTARQQAFVEEYIIDFNATQAAIRAGYAPASADVQGSQLLAKPHIAAAVERAKAQRLSRTQMTADTVLHEMSLLANSNLSHYIIDDKGNVQLAEGAPEGAMRAIQSIKKKTTQRFNDKTGELVTTYDVELRLWDKPTPLKLMGRHVGIFHDRTEVTGKNGGPIEIIGKIESVIIDPKE